MALLTDPRDTRRRGLSRYYRNVPLAANVIIFAGAAVGISSAGLAGPVSSTYNKVIGVAEETVDNRGGAASAKSISLARGEFLFDNDVTNALTVAHVTTVPEWTDDHTAANTSSSSTATGGVVVEVSSEGVWVEF